MTTYKDIEKIHDERIKNKVLCKCGCRSNTMPSHVDRVLCNWCNHYVYRTPEIEFKYKMKEEMRKRENKDGTKKNV